MKKRLIGIGVFALLAVGYMWWNTPHSSTPVVVAQAPIDPLTPDVLKALNEQIGLLAVNVPLATETVTPPSRERTIFILGAYTYSNGTYLTGGTLVVGFQGTRIVRTASGEVEVVLGSPITRALDDTFTKIAEPEDSIWSHPPPNVFEQARKQGRMQVLQRACTTHLYDMASVTAVPMVLELFKKATPNVVVTVNTTPAHCV